MEDIDVFCYDRAGPEYEFLDPELEAARQKFRESCNTFLVAVATYTFPTHKEGRQAVPEDWEIEQPEKFREAVSEIHTAADAVCKLYDQTRKASAQEVVGLRCSRYRKTLLFPAPLYLHSVPPQKAPQG